MSRGNVAQLHGTEMPAPDAEGRKAARSVTSVLRDAGIRAGLRPVIHGSPASTATPQSAYRADAGGAAATGNVLTRLAVVFLATINSVMWEMYTQAPVMALLWAAVAFGFVGWIIYDQRYR